MSELIIEDRAADRAPAATRPEPEPPLPQTSEAAEAAVGWSSSSSHNRTSRDSTSHDPGR
jgi:hypothetical protein